MNEPASLSTPIAISLLVLLAGSTAIAQPVPNESEAAALRLHVQAADWLSFVAADDGQRGGRDSMIVVRDGVGVLHVTWSPTLRAWRSEIVFDTPYVHPADDRVQWMQFDGRRYLVFADSGAVGNRWFALAEWTLSTDEAEASEIP